MIHGAAVAEREQRRKIDDPVITLVAYMQAIDTKAVNGFLTIL
jgi:hypothetical protein